MNTIQDHDFVLTVVSDTYLKRQAFICSLE